MERYSQFRDRASGVAPFLPVPAETPGLYWPLHLFLFCFRLPIFFSLLLTYFLVVQWLPIGSLGKKAALWLIIATPGLWWVDLQMDAVKKGTISTHSNLFPQPGSVITASFTSPLDILYLAVIFDPIFTASYPTTRLLQPISLLSAIIRAFTPPQELPPNSATLVDIPTILKRHPRRYIVVFPECTTTNGRGILKFSPSLLTASATTKIYPTSLRYTPADITSPLPNSYITFVWNLLSKPTHSMRVRIAQATSTSSALTSPIMSPGKGYESGLLDTVHEDTRSSSETLVGSEDRDSEGLAPEERRVLDRVGETLARLGRNKRVGMGVKEKRDFVRAWARSRR
ncbi:hypothetical protein MMC10_010227 [Thelotrema lepadinum]|nr:hypothetical protein [Thelotrema lepadinum]